MIASGHPDWLPIMFKDGDDIAGAAPALVKQIFDDLGITIEFPHASARVISKKSPFVRNLPDINRLIRKYEADGTVAKPIAKDNTQHYQDRNHVVAPKG